MVYRLQYAAAGTILGQFLFLSCVLFGFEWILIPFLVLNLLVISLD
jgi:hypothetical protein